MARFKLNLKKPNNYAFFCPQSRLHVTVSSPVGYANEVTSAIIRAVKSATLIDIDGVVNTADSQAKAEEPVKTAENTAPAQAEEQKPAEAAPEPKKTSKRGKKADQEEKSEQPAEEEKPAETEAAE